MVTPNKMRTEIEHLTADLIEAGLCIDQNFPSMKNDSNGDVLVGITETDGLSITLKNVSYSELYQELNSKKLYNMKFIDSGLVQIMYRFRADQIFSHRLAFFPSPDLLEYQNNSEIYDQDDLYADVIAKNIVTTPIRFDYDPAAFVDYIHPKSHMTIGQYKECRIPVSGPLSPFYFLNFILRAFYNTPFKKYCGEIRSFTYEFEQTITESETRFMHLRATA